MSAVSRRRPARVAGAGVALAGVGAAARLRGARDGARVRPSDVVPFRGDAPGRDRHPGAGPAALRRPRRDRPTTGRRCTSLLRRLDRGRRADDGRRRGHPGRRGRRQPGRTADDTGEALGLPASSLTLTFGVGRVAVREGRGRPVGLAPPGLARRSRRSPATSSTRRSPAATSASRPARTTRRSRCTPSATWCGSGFGTTAVRWSQLGFGRTSSTSTAQATPRNLFGFKDGTNNLKAEDPARRSTSTCGCAGRRAGRGWRAARYLVARRIRMHIEMWDRTSLNEQEAHRRPRQGRGRAAVGRPASSTSPTSTPRARTAQPAIAARRPHPARLRGRRWTGSRSCAAATTSSTAATGRAT